MKKQKLICIRCQEEIDKKKENWVKLEGYDKEIMVSQNHYHVVCWREEYNDKVKKIMTEGVMPGVRKLLGGMLNQ